MRKTIAVFGGSFNPPHVAHQMVCLYVLETQPVDEVLLVPTYRHPFEKQLAPYPDRIEMCRRLALPFGGRATVSTIEQELGGESSLTLVTLQALAERLVGCQLRLVIGSDILRERDKWYRWADIEALAPPIVVGRPGHPVADAPELAAISSTEVRARLADGKPIDAWIPRQVAAYIAERGLYTPR
jgi:nicotinate-nucleotide adenylyltransferase